MDEDEELSKLIDTLVAKGASDEEINIVVQDYYLDKSEISPEQRKFGDRIKSVFEGIETGANVAGAYTGQLLRGGLELIPQSVKLIGAADEKLQRTLGIADEGFQSPLTRAGQGIQEGLEFVTPTTQEAEESFLGQALKGVGQGLGMIASGGLGGAARAGTLATQAPSVARTLGQSFASRQAFLGGAMTAVPEYEAAKAAGASEDEAFDVLWKNYLIGQTEALPLHTFLRAINSTTGGLFVRVLKGMTEGGITEAAQETLQTYLSNRVAQGSYDPSRDPVVGLAEAAGLGFVVGAVIPGGGIIGRRVLGIDEEAKRAVKEVTPNLDPTIADQIDKQADEVVQSTLQNNEQTKEEAQKQGGLPVVETAPDATTQLDAIVEKVNVGESLTSEEADLLTQREQKEASQPIQGLTVTEATVPDLSSGDENATKKAQAFEFNDAAGEAKGFIDEKSASASITEIFAAKDKEGNVKKGGGLYKKLIDKLRSGGIHFLSIGMQSPASTKVLEKLTNEGVLRPVDAEKRRFEIVDKRFTKKQISNLVTEFNKRGMTLGATEESKSATKAAASEQLADFFREKGITAREDMDEFADRWNTRRPERAIKPSEVSAAYKLVVSPKEQGPTITVPVNTQVRNLIKTFTEGIEKGVRRGQKMINENLIPKVQKALKEARLSRRQTSAILTKLKSTNLFTPGSISRFNDFIDKVVKDSEYADKVTRARTLQRKLRRLSKRRSENEPVDYKPLARAFSKIDISGGDVNLDEFLDKASQVEGGFRAVTDPAYAAPRTEELEDYADAILDRQEQQRQADLEVSQLTKAAMGVDEAEGDYEEGDEEDLLLTVAKNTKANLEEKDTTGLNESEKTTIEQIREIDLSQLSKDQLARFIKIVDNIVTNDNFSGAWTIQNLSEVQGFIGEMEAKKPVVKEQIGWWGKVFNNYSNLFKQLYQDPKLEAFMRDFIVQDLLRFGSQSEKTLVDNSKRLDDLFKKINQKYGVEVRNLDKKAELATFAILYQADNEAEIDKMHRNIKQTIVRHEEAGNKDEAEAWKKAYTPYENVRNYREVKKVVDKVSPYSYEMWKFFGNDENTNTGIFNEEMATQQQEVTSNLHNREYTRKSRYTPFVQHNVNTLYKTAKSIQDTAMDEEGRPTQTINPQQARTALKRKIRLGDNMVYSSEPYADWIMRHSETFYSNKASRYEARIAELLHNKKFTELVGGKDNAEVVAKTLFRMVNIQRGTNRITTDNESEKVVSGLLRGIRTIGTVKALARFSQLLSQSTVGVKTYINLASEGGGQFMIPAYHASFESMKGGENHPVTKLLGQTTLVARGLRLGGTDRGTSEAYKLQRGAIRNVWKILERGKIKIDRSTRRMLQTIVVPDVWNARAAFLAYYMHGLKKQGVTDVNLNSEWKRTNEKERREAIAYAENMVEQTQTASNPAAMSQVQAQDASKGWEILKTMFLPFSTFDADFKARLVNEFSAMKNAPSKQNVIKFGGSVGEALTFSLLNLALLYWYREPMKEGIEWLFGLEGKEKTPEEMAKKGRQQFITSTAGALNPFAFGTVGQELQNMAINQIGFQTYNPNDLSKKEWLKENAWVYEPREGNTVENLGAYSSGIYPAVEGFKTALDALNVMVGNPLQTVDAYGNERYVELSQEQTAMLATKLAVEGLTMAGITEADVANAVRAIWREQQKLAPTADTTPKRKSNETHRERKFSLPKE